MQSCSRSRNDAYDTSTEPRYRKSVQETDAEILDGSSANLKQFQIRILRIGNEKSAFR